jgi:hypothetical protein
MTIEIACVHCEKTIVRSGKGNKEPTPFNSGGIIKCPYENCGKSWAQTDCPECKKTILRKGPNPSSFNDGRVTMCPYKTCNAKFSQTQCPGCDRTVVRSGDKSSLSDGNASRCPYEKCSVKFAKTHCPSCKRIVQRSGNGISGFNTGAESTCPYEDCNKPWAQLQCGSCNTIMLRDVWPATFAHVSKTQCCACHKQFRPPAAPPSDGTITFDKTSFADGTFREAYKAKVTKGTVSGFKEGTEMVLKCMKPEHHNAGTYITYKDVAMQEMVMKLAEEFNAAVEPTKGGEPCKLHVRAARLFTMPEAHKNSKGRVYLSKGETIALEQVIHGEYEKFNSNSGWSSGTATLPDAFSHWTWVHTGGDMLVCDLQGHRGRPGGPKYGSETYYYLLTDPAVVSATAGRFGDTDLGADGITQWFRGHTCNSMCESIGIACDRPCGPRRGGNHRRRTSYEWE